MCGIAGIWERSGAPVDRGALERMSAALVHRGPDGSGLHLDGALGLANRRLRIIDPRPSADQPMTLPDGSLWLTFNGEIHNYLELRRELEASGARLRSRSDTEVVLWAYRMWGRDCFERFNGMWALALWDVRHRELVLSRDRFGIKPLYYCAVGERISFASEAKAILAAFPEERRPHALEIERFLGGETPDTGSASFFERIERLAPATVATFSLSGMRHERYWRFVPGLERPRAGAEEEFRALLGDAVALRARSDAPLGACLSGGLDSSSVLALLERAGRSTVECFSLRYEEPGFDESRYAALATSGRSHVIHWVQPDPSGMLDTMRRIVWHHDAPTPIRGRFAQWFVMREAARHVKVVLEGQGGDELLAGYSRYLAPYVADRLRRHAEGAPSRRGLARELAGLAGLEIPSSWFLLAAPWRYLRDPRRGPGPYASAVNNMLWSELTAVGLPEALHAEDALSMAFGLESRPPFLDHRLVELCFSLPFYEKLSGGFTKSLLRRSLDGLVAPEILARRRKLGFPAPLVAWLRLPANRRAVSELLLDPRSLARGTVARPAVVAELSGFYRGPSQYAARRVSRLWRLITLELWFREMIDGGGFTRLRPH